MVWQEQSPLHTFMADTWTLIFMPLQLSSSAALTDPASQEMYQYMHYLSISMGGVDWAACTLEDNYKCIYQLTLLEFSTWERCLRTLAKCILFSLAIIFPGLWNYDSRIYAVYEDALYCIWYVLMHPTVMKHPRSHWGSNEFCIFLARNLFYWPMDISGALSPILPPQDKNTLPTYSIHCRTWKTKSYCVSLQRMRKAQVLNKSGPLAQLWWQ